MENKVLIASSHQAFADLLRHSLTGSRKYNLKVVLTKEELQELPDQQGFDLVILDADLPDQPLVSAVGDLKKQDKKLKLVVFPPDNRADHPAVAALSADAFLKKPFYLPDLQEILESLLNQAAISPEHDDRILPEDAEAKRYQYILNLILEESEAAAILLVKDQTPFAFVGDVDANSPSHIMNIIMQHWNADRRSDVVRFKRLQDGGKDYLFYATAINADLILVVVYERTISLTSARLHTSTVIRKIKNPPAGWMVNQDKFMAQQQSATKMSDPTNFETPVLLAEDLDWMDGEDEFDDLDEAEMINLEELLASMPNPDPNDDETELIDPVMDQWQVDPVSQEVTALKVEELEASQDEEFNSISPFLETDHFITDAEPFVTEMQETELTMPTEVEDEDEINVLDEIEPDTDPLADLVFPWDEQKPKAFGNELNSLDEKPEVEEINKEETPISAAADDSLLSLSDLINQKNELKTSSFSKFESAEESDELLEPLPEMIKKQELFKGSVESDSPIGAEDREDQLDKAALEPTQVVRRDFKESRTIPADLPPINPLEDTTPRSGSGAPKPILEPHSPGVSSLNYTSVLLPRFPTQFLAGELAECLGEWLPQLCVAYGWRLERISIRPRYIQWTVQVPPTVSPGYMVRILREETSRRILKNQPELLVNNPANDFWAPGYLVMSGFLPPTQQMLEEYIQQTRRRQGLEPQDN